MGVNGITNVAQTYDNKSTSKTKSNDTTKTDVAKQNNTEETAVVYEKSEQVETDTTKKVYKKDTATVERLLAEAEKRSKSLRDLIQKMFQKQGEAFTESTDIYQLLREGKVEVDEETQTQAQKDVAEDGYWGVNKTSDRMVSFAQALTGGDASKADAMIEAVKQGYEEATKAWGGTLPEISQKTLDATISKLEAWRDGTTVNTSTD
ncbi:MAG: hypothetical protein WBI07_16930 [Mobilitalea sp.]